MRELLKQFTGRQHTPLVQFLKYAIAGGIATGVHILLFYGCAWKLLPALTATDPVVKALHLQVVAVSDAIRARNSMIDNVVAFIFACSRSRSSIWCPASAW
jgi:hypothetical protein